MYNNPFMYGQYMSNVARPAISRGLLGGLRGINWGGILSNTQKTLGVINQTIPIVYQIKPIINNAKTMFKIANTLKDDQPTTKSNVVTTTPEQSTSQNSIVEDSEKPIFFI